MILTGFFARASLVAPVEVEGSVVVVVVVLVEAASSPASDSDSVSVRSSGHFITGAASIKLKGSTSVPLPKKVTRSVKNSLVSVPARATVRCWSASLRRAAAFPSSSAANLKSRSD